MEVQHLPARDFHFQMGQPNEVVREEGDGKEELRRQGRVAREFQPGLDLSRLENEARDERDISGINHDMLQLYNNEHIRSNHLFRTVGLRHAYTLAYLIKETQAGINPSIS